MIIHKGFGLRSVDLCPTENALTGVGRVAGIEPAVSTAPQPLHWAIILRTYPIHITDHDIEIAGFLRPFEFGKGRRTVEYKADQADSSLSARSASLSFSWIRRTR
jgi:hypothetical protein